ncbi:hypothetical protein E2320_013359 [Naja naja]|nr:hypothetical protein E2320_013359 [Naja naja]
MLTQNNNNNDKQPGVQELLNKVKQDVTCLWKQLRSSLNFINSEVSGGFRSSVNLIEIQWAYLWVDTGVVTSATEKPAEVNAKRSKEGWVNSWGSIAFGFSCKQTNKQELALAISLKVKCCSLPPFSHNPENCHLLPLFIFYVSIEWSSSASTTSFFIS